MQIVFVVFFLKEELQPRVCLKVLLVNKNPLKIKTKCTIYLIECTSPSLVRHEMGHLWLLITFIIN